MSLYFIPALFSFLLTLTGTFLAVKFFPKLGLMDRPWKYGLKREPIPYYGGLIIFFTFFISILFFVPLDSHLLALLFGAILIVSISFADDLFGLSPHVRLLVQIFAALVLVAAGVGIHSISNPFGSPILLDQFQFLLQFQGAIYPIFLLSALFTVVWIVAVTNTMNFLDGLNGLPSGVSAIAALTLFFLTIRPDIHFDVSSQTPVAMMSIILFASCLAFWLFDFYPAKILMGDTGSMFLGFMIATLAIFSGGKIATAFLVLGLPLLDALWVIVRRILNGNSPFKGDLKHLHHRLLEMGLSHRRALLLFYIICALFGGIAVFLEGKQKVYAIIMLLVFMLILAVLVVKGRRKINN
jgi:UDP-GlcNAc:undecaprenyl-phosphate GlcNAc-1-phosphate transferase